jgi:hypothetical protein
MGIILGNFLGLGQLALNPLCSAKWARTICEKYAHLSKLKQWTQRHVKYSERETLMVIFARSVV